MVDQDIIEQHQTEIKHFETTNNEKKKKHIQSIATDINGRDRSVSGTTTTRIEILENIMNCCKNHK